MRTTVKEAVEFWANGSAAVASNISTDGVSLISYGYYEIARHLGPRLVSIRASIESHSRTTAKQISYARAAARANGKLIVYVRGVSEPGGAPGNDLDQPDWGWVSLCYWYAATHANSNRRDGAFIIRMREGLELKRNDKRRELQGERLGLISLCAGAVGWGAVARDDGDESSGGSHTVDLNLFERIDPPLPPSCALALAHRRCNQPMAQWLGAPRWYESIFPDTAPPDIRRTDDVDPEMAFRCGGSSTFAVPMSAPA